MSTNYNPPIKDKDTKELLTIVENVEDWKEDALAQARSELVKRGYSIQQQKNRAKSKKRYQKRVNSIKAEATYSKWGLFALFIFAPFILAMKLILSTTLSGDTFLELKEDGYEKKWKQRLLVTTLVNLTWFVILYLSV